MYNIIIIHNLKMDSIDIISVKNTWLQVTTYSSSQGHSDKRQEMYTLKYWSIYLSLHCVFYMDEKYERLYQGVIRHTVS